MSSVFLTTGAWFGLATGLVEGACLLLFQERRWLSWAMSAMAVAEEILWISPLFDLLWFSVAALGFWVAAKLLPRLPWEDLAVGSFAFLAFFNFFALSGQIEYRGTFFIALGLAAVTVRLFRRWPAGSLRLWRRTLPVLAGIFILLFVSIEGGAWLRERIAVSRLSRMHSTRPNILVLVVDTLRADHLSSMGYLRATSPNLDRLASQGVLFHRAIAVSSWTLPSHASMLTGRFPYEHGAVRARYDRRYVMLPEVLSKYGYRSAAVSANTVYFARREGFGRGFLRFYDYFHSWEDMFWRTLFGRVFEFRVRSRWGYKDFPGRKRAPDVNREILDWVDRDRDVPFFLIANYFDLHDPYMPPQPYRSRFSKVPNPGGRVNGRTLQVQPDLTEEERQAEVDAYDGAITYADEYIGRLMAEFESRGLAENTIVVVVSDHGESFGEHGLYHHRSSLYRELIHVPLIFVWRKHLPEGVRVPVPVSIAALPATLMNLIGASEDKTFPGTSLATHWKNGGIVPNPREEYPLAELIQFHYKAVDKHPTYFGAMKSFVSPQWHYIFHEKFGNSLYDWQQDPQEERDLAKTPEGAATAKELEALLPKLVPSATPSGATPSGRP